MTDYGFIRVSTGSQDADSQERNIRRTSPNAVIITPDTKAASASKGQQLDALDELITKLNPGDRIIVTDSSRLDRRENLTDQIRTVLAIVDTGASILSLARGEENFSTDWVGTVSRQKANAEKSITVKEMTYRGVESLIANRASYGPLPFGWKAEGKKYHKQATCINPAAVIAIYTAVRDGKSLSSIAREYDTYPKSIRTLVSSRLNLTGIQECKYSYQGQTYHWNHETTGPVVDSELWNAANRNMSVSGVNGNHLNGRPVNKPLNWISGLLTCPVCGGNLYPLRNRSLRCQGRGKNPRGCGVSGINLAYVIQQIEDIMSNRSVIVNRYQVKEGNQHELDELNRELNRLNAISLTSIARNERSAHLDRIGEVEDSIASFELVADNYQMMPTEFTLADLWQVGDKRELMNAVQRYIGFNVGWSVSYPEVNGNVWIEGYPSNTTIELSNETAIVWP
jgi:DNA invertase Pin-like site-specific DNA recombinase